MNALREFFTPEAGQRRRAWLNEQDAKVANALRYALGPAYPFAETAAQGVNMLAGGADHRDAVQASVDLMGAGSGWDAVQAGATLGAASLGAMMPGVSARAVREGADMARGGAETVAQRVARLLRDGRGSEVTDDMMARVDPQEMHRLYTSGATGRPMPMDEASRMARAREMGFGAEAYHGTSADFQAFDVSRGGTGYIAGNPIAKEGIFSSPMAPYAEAFLPRAVDGSGQNVMPIVSRATRRAEEPLSSMRPERARQLRNQGVEAVELQSGGETWEYMDFDPRNIRSRFARFDPRLSHLANLSAGVAGVGVAGAMQQQQGDNWEQAREYLRSIGALE